MKNIRFSNVEKDDTLLRNRTQMKGKVTMYKFIAPPVVP
jgi:hypothetical protein